MQRKTLMSKSTKWDKIKEIFSEALELEASEKEKYIKRAAGGDTFLLKEVRSLLKAHDEPCMLDHLPGKMRINDVCDKDLSEMEGRRIGSYRIIRELGCGGMGIVYLAERADGQFHQRAALKLLSGAFISDYQIHRFLAERQILASLNHDNISRLLDGGVTENGQPYFVMEYVKGVPIDRYCYENHLTIEQRLELFLDVCNAVKYAHRKLIVHRDLKPSNILVTKEGKVKLLDFGIAKILEPEALPGNKTDCTTPGILPVTPAYASPEMVKGKTITTSSDIYQLGVILYELLSGCRPYCVSGKTAAGLEHIICDTKPLLPSSAIAKKISGKADSEIFSDQTDKIFNTKPGKLKRKLRGDPDAIVMMAMDKLPDRRYQSVEKLCTDIRHYLSGRPVTAHMDSLFYRASKIIKRHKAAIATAVIILMLLIGYAGTVTWHSQRTQQALEQAQKEAAKSEQIVHFMMRMFEAGNPEENAGENFTARMLLERGIEEANLLEGQPEVKAQMYNVVGKVYLILGEYKRAEELHSAAVEIQENLPDTDLSDLSKSLNNLAVAYTRQGDYNRAADLHRKALNIQIRHFGDEHPEVAETLSLFGSWIPVTDIHEAARLRERSLEIRRTVYGEGHLKTADSYMETGRIKRSMALPDDAAKAFQKAMDIRLSELGPDHPDVAESMIFLGDVYRLYEIDKDSSETLYRNAMQILQNTNELFNPNLLHVLGSYAELLSGKGDHSAAQKLLERSLEIRRDVFGADHPATVGGLNQLAREFYKQGRYDKAEELFRKCLSRQEEIYGQDHLVLVGVLRNLGNTLVDIKQFNEAENYLKRALQIQQNKFGSATGSLTIGALARLNFQRGNLNQAEELYQKALSAYESDGSLNHYDAIYLQDELEKLQTAMLMSQKVDLQHSYQD